MPKLRELILLRHGKSDWKNDCLDVERPLSDKGKKAITKVQQWLVENHLQPDLILSSPATRAKQTLKRICPNQKINQLEVQSLYLAPLSTLLKTLSEIPKSAQTVMLIGHNPGLEELITYLSETRKTSSLDPKAHLLPTGGLAHFVLPEDWHHLQAGAGKLIQLIQPKNILIEPF